MSPSGLSEICRATMVKRGSGVTAVCSKESIHQGKKIWDSGCTLVVSVQKRRLRAHAGRPSTTWQTFPWGHRASWLRPHAWRAVEWEWSGSHTQLHTSRLCASGKLTYEASLFFNLQNGDSITNPKCLICISKIPKYLKTENIFISLWQTHLAAKRDPNWHGACWGLSLSHFLSICMYFAAKY